MVQNQAENVHSCAVVILCKNGKEKAMSFGAFERIELEGMPMANRALLHKKLLSGDTVAVRLTDSMCKQGTVRLAH